MYVNLYLGPAQMRSIRRRLVYTAHSDLHAINSSDLYSECYFPSFYSCNTCRSPDACDSFSPGLL